MREKLSERAGNGEFHDFCDGRTDTLEAEIAALEQRLEAVKRKTHHIPVVRVSHPTTEDDEADPSITVYEGQLPGVYVELTLGEPDPEFMIVLDHGKSTQSAIDAALESLHSELIATRNDARADNCDVAAAAYDLVATAVRMKIGSNPLAERDARIAELENERDAQQWLTKP